MATFQQTFGESLAPEVPQPTPLSPGPPPAEPNPEPPRPAPPSPVPKPHPCRRSDSNYAQLDLASANSVALGTIIVLAIEFPAAPQQLY